jgi:hypothetical protein
MKVREFLNLIDGIHELVFYDKDGNWIFKCNSDSIVLNSVADWIVESFKTGGVSPYNNCAGLMITVSKDLPF